MSVITNNYMLKAKIDFLSELGFLDRISTPSGEISLESRDGYYKLFFKLSDLSVKLPLKELPIITYLTYRGEVDRQTERWLMSQGFKLCHTQLRLSASTVNAELRHEITQVSETEALQLFNSAFSPLTADLPRAGYGLFDSLAAIRGADGAPLGALYSEGKTVSLIAVDDKARGQGIATSLFSYFAAKTENIQGEYRIWVVDENAAAYKLYRKLGFSEDGLKSNLYIREK